MSNSQAPAMTAWKTKPLGELFDVVGGGTPSKKKSSYYGGNIPWATIRDMHSGTLTKTEHTITEQGLQASSAKLIPAGEVIMASRVGLGKACLLHQDTAINQDIRALIPRNTDAIDRRFCLYWLQTQVDVIIDAGSGATVQGIKLPFIKSLPFPDICVDEQKRIVAVLDQAFAAIDRARANAEGNLSDGEALFASFLAATFAPRESWACLDLGEQVKFIDYRGKTPPKTDAGVPLITAKNVRMGYIKRDPREFIPEDAYEAWMTRGFPERGDVLFTTEAPLANVAELDTDEKVVIGQRLITFKTNPEVIVPRFLKWSLISPQMQEEIHSYATGATVLGIKAKLLKKVRLYIPRDIGQQKSIAAKCEVAFNERNRLVAAYNRKVAEVDELRQAVLRKAFAGELT